MSAILVFLPAELFNDALYFLEEAKKLSKQPENDFLRWRYLRASIIYSLTAFETEVNIFITGHIRERLKLPNVAEEFAVKRSSIETKVEQLVPILIGKEFNKSTKEWADWKAVKKIRNRIVHYTGGTEIYNDNDPLGVNISNAEKAIEAVSGMITQLIQLVGSQVPPWVKQRESRIIR